MTDTASPPAPNATRQFVALVEEAFDAQRMIQLSLGKYRGADPDLRRILVRPLSVKGQPHLSFVFSYKTRDVTKNVALQEGLAIIGEQLGDPFKSAHLFTLTEDVQLVFSRKGKPAWCRSAPSRSTAPTREHNRAKQRSLEPTAPFLMALGVTNEDHQIIPSMARKWKQINRFLEVFDHAFTSSRLASAETVRVVDFGSGKGYLTFAIHNWLCARRGIGAQVTGIELRPNLLELCRSAAAGLEGGSLQFQQGELGSYAPPAMEVLIALHACDTATDLALHMGIRAGADIIMCAPCCHKQIRPQLKPPPVLAPLLQFGVHLGQEAEMVTDTLRALLLEAHGYRTTLQEFVSLEHTSKNKMLLGIKRSQPLDPAPLLAQVEALKSFYGVQTHALETLLQAEDESV